jgi:hypothetical protein
MTCTIPKTHKVSFGLRLEPIEITPYNVPRLPDNTKVLKMILQSCTARNEFSLDSASIANTGNNICVAENY